MMPLFLSSEIDVFSSSFVLASMTRLFAVYFCQIKLLYEAVLRSLASQNANKQAHPNS